MKFNMTGSSRKAVMAGLLGALSVAGVVATAPQAALAVDGDTDAAVDYTAPTYTGWNKDKSRWYDNGVMAAEHAFYDPESDEWYWADADCTIAKDKDVYIPKDETKKNADGTWGDGKWVRVDEQGVMVKGADFTSSGDLYVFDKITGEMYHGEKYLDSSDIWGSIRPRGAGIPGITSTISPVSWTAIRMSTSPQTEANGAVMTRTAPWFTVRTTVSPMLTDSSTGGTSMSSQAPWLRG